MAIGQDRGLRARCRGCFRSQILPSCSIQNLPWLGHRKEEGGRSELMRQKRAYRAFVCRLRAGHVLNESLPLSVMVDEVQRVVRAWLLEQSTATLGCLQNPITPAPAVTAEGSTVRATSIGSR